MIETLRIRDLAIVEEAELEFGPGLNVLTGETGAGKSVVLGALSLLAGGRASAEGLRQGVESGSAEAVFSTAQLPELEAALAERGLELDDDHQLVVHRTVSRNGRGRARLLGQLVPVSLLGELFDGRVEISSQHSSQALLRPETHGLFLDAAGQLTALRATVEEQYAAVRELDAQLVALRDAADERERRRDFLTFQRDELDEADLQPGEIDALTQELSRLGQSDRLRAEVGAAVAAVMGEAMGGEGEGAVDRLRAAVRALAGLEDVDPGLRPLLERLRGLETELGDAAAELERYADGVEADPGRLAEVEERLGQVERLRRKYGRTEEELFAYRDSVLAELDTLAGDAERGEGLAAERSERVAALGEAAARLTKGRQKAARKLARELQAELTELAMPNARIEIELRPSSPVAGEDGVPLPCGPTGAEIPEFAFSANEGEPPRPLRKVASGGELSRVFLALKNALRRTGAGMVLVFDEVDAGVGGRVAERIGRVLADLAREHQVLCITHLPQIAVFADTHFHVQKRKGKGGSVVEIRRVEGDERIDEVARMAAGESVTEATRAHARELLRVKSP